jgi:hypothetical protein
MDKEADIVSLLIYVYTPKKGYVNNILPPVSVPDESLSLSPACAHFLLASSIFLQNVEVPLNHTVRQATTLNPILETVMLR